MQYDLTAIACLIDRRLSPRTKEGDLSPKPRLLGIRAYNPDMRQIYDDGGRETAGYKSSANDCITRSIAIATRLPYQAVYDAINEIAKSERHGKRKRGISSARTGVFKYTTRRYLQSLGWVWTPTMHIGSGCTVHLRARELPTGRLIVSLSKHMTAVIDGVIHDTHDPSRNGNRCVYGYWTPPPNPPSIRSYD